MESIRGEECQSRFISTASELHDHSHSVPSIVHPAHGRRATIESVACGSRPDFLQVRQRDEAALQATPVARDFEQAVIDDDKSVCRENVGDRLESTTPGLVRRGASYRNQAHINRSRDSSPSSRSTSPANSVDAFADPRRRERANTIGSKGPSDLDLGIQRTVSSSTHQRRPTFSNGSICQLDVDEKGTSFHGPPEDDICYPRVDEVAKKTYRIDFEELDEFVAQTTAGKQPSGGRRRQRLSFSSQGKNPKLFACTSAAPSAPKLDSEASDVTHVDAGNTGCIKTESHSILNDKDGDLLGANGPSDQQSSLLAPRRFSFFSSELEETIHAADFPDLLAPGVTSRDLFEHPVDEGVWWMDILNPTEEELLVFQRAFGIHRLTTEDIITQEAREKVELFPQYYFVCFRSFQMDVGSEDFMDPINVYMVVFREGILTFTYKRNPHAANVRKRIGKLRDYMALTADWICYAMIDDIVDSFGPVIHSIELETDTIEDQVFVARNDDLAPLLRQVGECRKKVMSLMRLLGGKADVIKGFAKRCNESYVMTPRGEIGLYLGDIQDHVVTMMSNLGYFENLLSRSHSNYLAQLSVDQIAQGTRANEVLSKITLLGTILVPLNLVCGLFGMNVPVPGGESQGLRWFFGILGVIIAMVVTALHLARRHRFL